MKELKFTAPDEMIDDLDLICERCGLETRGQVLMNAVALLEVLTQHAADGERAIILELADGDDGPVQASLLAPDILLTASRRARETERALLPSAPAPVAPASTPAPARPWWQFWGRA